MVDCSSTTCFSASRRSRGQEAFVRYILSSAEGRVVRSDLDLCSIAITISKQPGALWQFSFLGQQTIKLAVCEQGPVIRYAQQIRRSHKLKQIVQHRLAKAEPLYQSQLHLRIQHHNPDVSLVDQLLFGQDDISFFITRE